MFHEETLPARLLTVLEVDPSAPTRIVHEIPVWTSKPYWDSPGYATEEAQKVMCPPV